MNGLSLIGVRARKSTLKLAEKGMFANIDFIYSSEESKAFHTAKIIADALGKKVHKLSNFTELDRSKTDFLKNYDNAVMEAFANLLKSRNNWESCADASKWFRDGIGILNERHENRRILIVSHGIVLTLYFAYLKREINHLFSRWKKLQYLSYGIIEDSEVIRDIIKINDQSIPKGELRDYVKEKKEG